MKNIKLTALILAAMLTVGVFANISFGQYAETDMEYDDIMLMARSIFPEGEGTEESPFIISTAEQFDIIADLPDLCYELKNDIPSLAHICVVRLCGVGDYGHRAHGQPAAGQDDGVGAGADIHTRSRHRALLLLRAEHAQGEIHQPTEHGPVD